MSVKMINKTAGTSKVNFFDEHVDNVITENNVLRSKLQSKVEALAIISKQLDKVSIEKDRYKLLAEQFQTRYPYSKGNLASDIKPLFNGSDVGNVSGAQMLANTREQNKLLVMEVEVLKQKLEEAQEDIKVLRKQKKSPQRTSDKNYSSNVNTLNFEREELVRQLEKLNKKVEQLQADLRSMLDEKEDLINERDAYKCKLHRLNHQLMMALSKKTKLNGEGTKNGPMIDIDSLIMENRYLQERLNQAMAEKELATHALTKYKSILETKHRKGTIKLGSNQTNAVVTHKQVKELLEGGAKQELPVTAATIKDLRALSFGLLDSLNDKSIALSHQKKANRILANRIGELEKRFDDSTDNDGNGSLFPSKILLESYCSSEVDTFTINEKNEAEQDTVEVKNLEEDTVKESDSNNGDSANSESSSDMSSSPDDGKRKNENQRMPNGNAIVVEHNLHEYEDENLPPELQKLVQEALENIYVEEQDK